MARVDEIMTNNPVTVDASATVAEAMTTLHDLDVRHLPVVDNGELVGILSDRDLRGYAAPDFVEDGEEADVRERLETLVSDVMAADVATLEPESGLTEAIDMMIEERVGALPVVNARSQELAGIVSYVDILRAVRESL